MSGLSALDKTSLEIALNMRGGYVLDFSNASFENFFSGLDVKIYDDNRYQDFGDSKANHMRAFWKHGSNAEVSASLLALADYIETKKTAGVLDCEVTTEQIERMREIAGRLSAPQEKSVAAPPAGIVHASFTTEATVADNKIQIEIHDDIYNHISQYLSNEDYFHAVEESYKLVRMRLRERTGKEKATDAFAESNQEKIFGHMPRDPMEKDFYEGVKFLNMSIQFLRNEKAHTPATPLEPNLALHYISLASLAYDLITRYVSDDLIDRVESLIRNKRRSLSATAFYPLFAGGQWIATMEFPKELESSSVRRVLKNKWLAEADFTRSYDHSNVMLMRLQVVAQELSADDLDDLVERPTKDIYGNYQGAGMVPFMNYMREKYSSRVSSKVDQWIADQWTQDAQS